MFRLGHHYNNDIYHFYRRILLGVYKYVKDESSFLHDLNVQEDTHRYQIIRYGISFLILGRDCSPSVLFYG